MRGLSLSSMQNVKDLQLQDERIVHYMTLDILFNAVWTVIMLSLDVIGVAVYYCLLGMMIYSVNLICRAD